MIIVEYSEQAHSICKRPYTKYVVRDSDGFYISICQEFNDSEAFMGCYSQGDDSEDALEMLEDAMLIWVQCALDDGYLIPEPSRIVSEYGNSVTYFGTIDMGMFR